MSAELVTAIIALLGVIGTFIKAKTDTEKINAQRLATKSERDKDSQDLHDKVLKIEAQQKQNDKDIAYLFVANDTTNKTLTDIKVELAKITALLEQYFKIQESK